MNKNDLLHSANAKALELIHAYRHIQIGKLTISTPYFNNEIEKVYVKAMKDIGIENELVHKLFMNIRSGKTDLGATIGKGTPEQIETDIHKLFLYLKNNSHDFSAIENKRSLAAIIRAYHIGIDCSGLVFRILEASLPQDQFNDFLSLLHWRRMSYDAELVRTIFRANVSLFMKGDFIKISKHEDIQPLDLFVLNDESHMGIIVENNDELCLVDSSYVKEGVSLNRIMRTKLGIQVERRPTWSKLIRSSQITVLRLPFFA